MSEVQKSMECNRPYDIILMDYQMPQMDGPTATKEIRRLGYKGIIIGVTGNSLLIDIETFMKAGANDVLLKPLNFKALEKAISGNFFILFYFILHF